MSVVTAVRARFQEPHGAAVRCTLCPHDCVLSEGESGLCGVRRNAGGELVTDVYGLAAVAQPSPIERKFLYHYAPGTRTYSFAAPGCNLRCSFCQNWIVSQMPKGDEPRLEGRRLEPAELVAEAVARDCPVVACTYTEATIFFEYALDVARRCRAAGLGFVWKTNGYTHAAPQAEMIPLLSAVNVDLKSFVEETHQRVVGGRLGPVLESIRRYRAAGVWLELTTPVIPTVNDSPAELDGMARFIRDELGPQTPWHLTRFHPDHELKHLPPTPRETLHTARERALALGLRFVYTDAESRGEGWHTCCPGCGAVVVEREQYRLTADRLVDGCCPACGARVAGRWSGITCSRGGTGPLPPAPRG
ncbi:MAG: AmmeMemoRadiSam system radical SAM enzyme [Armatimonadetes bacterium]|nr:AmmeMemoRadiSam system radical SAM enzyme [Armatimonadota bacterium]